ncbi:MAG TPA: sodium:alanine symporter family protein, partial [bacterium]|nr:sodium:alanine symporter family protein [bacterium]
LTILASGMWNQKADEVYFQQSDLEIVAGRYVDTNPDHVQMLNAYLVGDRDNAAAAFTGEVEVRKGLVAGDADLTILHARSVAEDVVIYKGGEPLTGKFMVIGGKPGESGISMKGRSRLHSAALTAAAFERGILGTNGKYIVSIGLILFAFSTAISWSYYGDRAITYLLGLKFVLPYRVVFVALFFMGALLDTTIVWNFASIAIVLMAVPNLFGILLLHRDMKTSIADYWIKFKKEHPDAVKKYHIK